MGKWYSKSRYIKDDGFPGIRFKRPYQTDEKMQHSSVQDALTLIFSLFPEVAARA